METTIKQRVMSYIENIGITVREFERVCGMANGYVRGIDSSIGEKKLKTISLMYPSLNIEWLLTGEGEMLKDSQSNATVSKKPTASLPLIPIDAVAGFPGDDDTGVKLVDCEQYHVPEFVAKGAQFLIRVSGSSMYPKYSNGDILACRKIDSVTFFQWGKVYVMDTCQGALVKRIFEDKDDKDNVICHSDNHDNYPDFKLPKSEIRSLSIVLGVIRME